MSKGFLNKLGDKKISFNIPIFPFVASINLGEAKLKDIFGHRRFSSSPHGSHGLKYGMARLLGKKR